MFIDDVEIDYQWFQEDGESYQAEMDRYNLEKETQFREFMGDEFKDLPLKTLDELINTIQNISDRLSSFHKLCMPPEIINNEQTYLASLMTELQNKQYALTQSELDYREAYFNKEEKFVVNFTPNVPDKYIKLLIEKTTEPRL